MKKLWIPLLMVALLHIPVEAVDFSAPQVPQSAQQFMPDQTESFSEGLLTIIQNAMGILSPSLSEAAAVCLSLIAVSLLSGLLKHMAGAATGNIEYIATGAITVILLQPLHTFINLAADTVQQISQYGKLLLPVMTASLAAQGAVTKSGALYTATAVFDGILSNSISRLLIPLVYIFLCVAIACSLARHPLLTQMRKFLKWLPTWMLKIILYLFTGFISITGVVAGTTDASALKATKLTIAGMIPVVGSILSDASEAVLVSAGLVKNAVGIYGLLAVIALGIGPFLQIGVEYIMLKVTAGICAVFAPKSAISLMEDYSAAMGLLLAMTGAVCFIFLISIICFMKGVM